MTTAQIADAAIRSAFAHWFGLEPGSSLVLVALYHLAGEPTAAPRIAELAQSTAASVVGHHLRLLRQALNAEAIDYKPGEGYYLTPQGLGECRAVLWTIGEELRHTT
jgi:hypothetical protein